MVHYKFILGGLAATGTVATAGVVANEYGLFSSTTNNESGSENVAEDTTTDRADNVPAESQTPATESTTSQTKTNQQEIQQWLTDNQGSSTWKIQIKKSNDTPSFSSVDDGELEWLKGYLESKKDPLKSLFAVVDQNTLTFEKKSDAWTYSITHGNITSWVSANWGGNTTLKIEGESTTELSSLQEEELRILFEHLFSVKSEFENLKNASNTKIIVFEKADSTWKHIKKAIEDLITSKSWNKSKIKIKSGTDATPINFDNVTDDNLLIGLFKHLNEKKDTDYSNLTSSSDVTFVKNGTWSKEG